MNRKKKINRQSNFDLLRIISTIAVVLIHVNANVADSNNISLDGFNICSLINIITRFSVPCFVMLSGAFILNNEKNADYKHFYAKSFYKIGIPLVIILILSFLIAEMKAIIGGRDLLNPVFELLSGNLNNCWFMFMLVGLYFLVPIIIRIKKSISNRSYIIGSFIWLFVAMISQLTSTYSVSWAFGIIFSFVGYFLVGNVIYENMSRIKFKGLYFIFAVICYVILFIYRGRGGYTDYCLDPYLNCFSPMMLIASVCVFIGFGGIKINIDLSRLSGYTYVLYLLHTNVYIVLYVLTRRMFPSLIEHYILCLIVIAMLTFIISCIGAMIYDLLWSLLEKKFNIKEKWNNLIYRNK